MYTTRLLVVPVVFIRFLQRTVKTVEERGSLTLRRSASATLGASAACLLVLAFMMASSSSLDYLSSFVARWYRQLVRVHLDSHLPNVVELVNATMYK